MRPSSSLVSAILLLGIFFTACKKSDNSKEGGAGRLRSSETPAPVGTKSPARFKMVKYVDRDGIGIEAFRMLIPADWKFDGKITWLLDNPGMPAVARFKVTSPTGHEEFEVFPNQPFFWTTNTMLLQMFPVGSKYFGNEVRRPLDALQALKGVVIPRFRRNLAGLRIVSEQQLPELAKSLGAGQAQPGVSVSADGAKVRIEYQLAQRAVEEELYGVVESYTFPIQSMMGTVSNTIWTADYLFSFKADKGNLDASGELLQSITSSFQLNPQWHNRYTQVVEYLISRQIQHIRNIGELSRIISQTHNEISESNLRSYYDRQAVYDRLSDNFSQHIRGVDAYYDPYEQRSVELPSGYRHAWTNNLGEYILTDQEDFNPNIGSNLHWQMMERK